MYLLEIRYHLDRQLHLHTLIQGRIPLEPSFLLSVTNPYDRKFCLASVRMDLLADHHQNMLQRYRYRREPKRENCSMSCRLIFGQPQKPANRIDSTQSKQHRYPLERCRHFQTLVPRVSLLLNQRHKL